MLDWFPAQEWNDAGLLEAWRGAAPNYEPNQPIDRSWKADGYERILGVDQGDLFERAVEQLMRFHFYPGQIMHTLSDFEAADRRLQPRDYLLQRLHILPRILDVITLNQVANVIYESQRVGVTFRSTEQHIEMGEWTAVVVRKPDQKVALLVHAVSTAGPKMPFWARPFSRFFQLRAHQAGLAHFEARLHAGGA